MQWLAKLVLITSLGHPSTAMSQMHGSTEQIMRRLHEIIEVKDRQLHWERNIPINVGCAEDLVVEEEETRLEPVGPPMDDQTLQFMVDHLTGEDVPQPDFYEPEEAIVRDRDHMEQTSFETPPNAQPPLTFLDDEDE
jgi:hypothetical protein